MKQKLIWSLLIVLGLIGLSIAQSLIRPKTAADNLGTTTYPFGTVYCASVQIGAQAGWTGVVTNKMSNYTNLTWVGGGIITNVTLVGALP